MKLCGICNICNQIVLSVEKASVIQEDIDMYQNSSRCADDMGSITLKQEVSPNEFIPVVIE